MKLQFLLHESVDILLIMIVDNLSGVEMPVAVVGEWTC